MGRYRIPPGMKRIRVGITLDGDDARSLSAWSVEVGTTRVDLVRAILSKAVRDYARTHKLPGIYRCRKFPARNTARTKGE